MNSDNTTWLLYPGGAVYPAIIVRPRLWGRVEVIPQVPAPDAGQTRIVHSNELIPR